jgi:hypothetical protein
MIAFDGVLLILFAAFVIIGAGYQPMARELPLPISIIGVLLVIPLLVADIFPGVNKEFPFIGQAKAKKNVQSNSAKPSYSTTNRHITGLNAKQWIRITRLICWMIALIIGMQFIGYLTATGCFVFLVTWLEGRLKWWKSLLSAIGTVIFFYIVFNLFLAVTF